MREIQVQAEWRQAVKTQGAAELLLEAGFYEDAVSRAYYAVLHAAKAALLARDIITESHTAVRRLFGKELVQPGLLEKEWAMILAHAQGRTSFRRLRCGVQLLSRGCSTASGEISNSS